MRTLIILATLSSLLFLISGCGSGMAYSGAERHDRFERIAERDCKQFVDDWDSFWLQDDDPTRLTKWRVAH